MSERREWFHGVLESEFWTVYRGWRVFIRKGLFGWRWSIMRQGIGKSGIENNRPSAEAAAFEAVCRVTE